MSLSMMSLRSEGKVALEGCLGCLPPRPHLVSPVIAKIQAGIHHDEAAEC